MITRKYEGLKYKMLVSGCIRLSTRTRRINMFCVEFTYNTYFHIAHNYRHVSDYDYR
jgi:hypothetical protein